MLTCVEKAIRAFEGKQNAGLRKLIRKAAQESPGDVEVIVANRVALTPVGKAKLEVVAAALRQGNCEVK